MRDPSSRYKGCLMMTMVVMVTPKNYDMHMAARQGLDATTEGPTDSFKVRWI
jgi:hypothetical protein